MSDKFSIEIISPEKTILKSETSEVVIPSFEGQMGILKDHIPIITFLRPGLIKILNDDETTFFETEDGHNSSSRRPFETLTSAFCFIFQK